jgi:hypothetical protein
MLDLDERLDQCERDIEAGLARQEFGRREWIEGTLQLAEALSRGRSEFASNALFGAWLDRSFGARSPKPNERSILIQWAGDPTQARALLEGTESRSIQLIHQHFRLTSTIKTEAEAPSTQTPTFPGIVAGDIAKQTAREQQRLEREAAQERARAIREREREQRQQRDAAERERQKQAQEAERARRMADALAREQAAYQRHKEQFKQFEKDPDFDPEKFVMGLINPNGGAALTVAEWRILAKCVGRSPDCDEKTEAQRILNDKKFKLTGVKAGGGAID